MRSFYENGQSAAFQEKSSTMSMRNHSSSGSGFRRVSKKEWRSTKDRFVSRLHNRTLMEEMQPPWYRRRSNFLTLIVIAVFVVMAFAVKAIVQVMRSHDAKVKAVQETVIPDNESAHPEDKNDAMDYEEAKKVFGG